MKKVLITGANGFVGHYVAQQLLQKSYKVVATGKGNCRLPFRSKNFLYETLDFTNEEAVSRVFKKHQPDIVIHSGAISKPDECELDKEKAFLINVTGTKYLLKHSEIFKSFFIFLSSDFIFSGEEEGMYAEEDAAAPVNYYGHTKLLAEEEVKQYVYDWSIVRTVLVYGPTLSGRHNILTFVAEGLKKERPLQIFNDQIRTPTYVEDLAEGIVRLVENHKTGIYHISGEEVLTPYDMAIAVAEYLRLNTALIKPATAATFDQPARRPLKTGFNIAKAKKELDYACTPFKEGLAKTFTK